MDAILENMQTIQENGGLSINGSGFLDLYGCTQD